MTLRHLKRSLAALLILGQIAGIVAARFVPERFFCWAPYEEVTLFEIEATLDSRPLTSGEIQERYGMARNGRQDRSIHNVISVLRWRESREKNPVTVRLNFTTNGRPQQVWAWPEDAISSSD